MITWIDEHFLNLTGSGQVAVDGDDAHLVNLARVEAAQHEELFVELFCRLFKDRLSFTTILDVEMRSRIAIHVRQPRYFNNGHVVVQKLCPSECWSVRSHGHPAPGVSLNEVAGQSGKFNL